MSIYDHEGTVLDSISGAGLSDLQVEVWDTEEQAPEPLGEATTDADGRFSMSVDEEAVESVLGTFPEQVSLKVMENGVELTDPVHRPTWELTHSVRSSQIYLGLPLDLRIDGVVADAQGGPIADVDVQVLSRRAEEAGVVELLLTRTDSNAEGRFRMRHTVLDGRPTNLVVRAFDGAGTLIAESDPVVRATGQVDVELIVGGPTWQGRTEAEVLDATLARDLAASGASLAAMEQDAARTLAGSVEADGDRVVELATASTLAQSTGVPRDVFYGLARQGMPADMHALVAAGADLRQQAFDQAISKRVVPPTAGVATTSTMQQLSDALVSFAMEEVSTPDRPAVKDILASSLVAGAVHQPFVRLFVERSGTDADFWQTVAEEQVAGEPVFSAEDIDELQTVVRCAQVLQGWVAPLQQLAVQRGQGQYSDFRSVAAIPRGAWVSMVQQTSSPIVFPSHVPGETEQAKLDHFVDAVVANLDEAFPNDALRRDLGGGEELSLDAKAVLAATPDVDLRTANLDDYAASNGGSIFAGLANPNDPDAQASALAEVKAVQRLFAITSKSAQVQKLLGAGFNSAWQIANASKGDLEDALSDLPDGGDDALEIQAVAKWKVGAVQMSAVAAHQARGFVADLMKPDTTLSTEADTLTQLLGGNSYCACAHCKSVHSPAAYLVDLMAMLDTGGEATPENPLNVLLRRRPDLAQLELSCSNSNTVLPYVDLVNEVLESVAAHVASGDPNAPGDPTSELIASNTGTMSSEALLATPQTVVSAAYDALAVAPYPLALPFSEPWEVVRAYLDHADIGRLGLMKTLQGFDPTTVRPLAYEQLGLSFEQGQVIVAPSPDTWIYFGFPNATEWDTTLLAVPQVLARTGLTHDELVELLATRFISGAGVARVDSPGGDCDLSQMVLLGADAGTFARLHRFVRLQRACGWSTADLDLAIHSLGATDLTGPVLDGLAVLEGLRVRLDAPIAQLCAMWAPLDTRTEASLYARLFLNPTVLPTVAGAFELDDPGDELLNASQSLDDHAAAVASAIGASIEELDILRAALDYMGPVAMTLATLSDLYRHRTLARLLRIHVGDLLALRTMAGGPTSLFVSQIPSVTRDFVELALELSESPIALTELRYLVLRETSAGQSPAPTDLQIQDALEAMQEDLAEASEIYGVPDEMNQAELSRRLAVFIDDDMLVRDLVAALDLSVSTDPLQGGLSIDQRKDLYDDHVAAVDAADHAALFDNAPVDDLGLAQRHLANITLVIAALNPWLEARLAPVTVAASLATSMGIHPERMTALLELHLQGVTTAPAPLMQDFVQMSDASAMRASYERLHVAVRIVDTLSIDGPELSKLLATLDDPAPTQPADLRTWPTVAPETPRVQLDQWRQLNALSSLSRSMDLAVATPGDISSGTDLAATTQLLADATGWSSDDLTTLQTNFGWTNDDLTTGVNLVRLRDAVAVVQGLGVSAQTAVDWAASTPNAGQAQQVVHAIRARHTEADWLQVAKALNDPLRDLRREALVAYLAHRLQPAGVHSVADLSAYLLIDVEMTSCMRTSRIKQAISSVQRFVQRVLLNLERGPEPVDPNHDDNVPPEQIDAEGWKWRKNYRVWEANRKVFLYPENWLEPELRMDRTPFFRELEGELLQQDLTEDVVEQAVGNYLHKLHEVARLDVVALSAVDAEPGGDDVLHVIGRANTVPSRYYHRTLTVGRWSPWERLDTEIASDHHLLVTTGRRARFFWLTVEDVTQTEEPFPIEYTYKLRLHVMEHRAGRWRPATAVDGTVLQRVVTDDGDGPQRLHLVHETEAGGSTIAVYMRAGGKIKPVARVRGTCGYERLVPSSGVLPAVVLPQNMEISGQTFVSRPDDYDRLVIHTTVHGKDSTENITLSVEFLWSVLGLASEPSTLVPSTSGLMHFDSHYRDFAYMDDQSVFVVTARNRDEPLLLPPLEADAVQKPKKLKNGFGSMHHSPKVYNEANPSVSNLNEDTLRFRAFHHPHVCDFIDGWARGGVEGLFGEAGIDIANAAQLQGNGYFAGHYAPRAAIAKPWPERNVDFDYGGAYAQYNWELFFHVPLLVATRLQQAQRHAEAQRWFHLVFDPTTTDNGGAGARRYWKFKPLRDGDAVSQVNSLLAALMDPNADPALVESMSAQLAAWQRFPFEPHRVAQLRPAAYQTRVIMRYLDNLIEWGDRLFRRDTIESINEATQLYELAAHVLGPKPTALSSSTPETTSTYAQLREALLAASPDAADFGNVLVDAENLVLSAPASSADGGGLVNAGIGNTLFCLSPNEHMLGYWDRVADRLFKIRHCQNIEGQRRTLALFAPPIDPALLIRAQAAGLDLGSVLDGLSAGPGNYRFSVLLAKAQQLAAEARSLGASMLSAIEKKDAETLAALRADHEIEVLDVLRKVKVEQQQEVAVQRQVLMRSREHAGQRHSFYERLVSGDGRIAQEREHLNKLSRAHHIQQGTSQMQLMASVLALVPNFTVGLAAGSTFGGSFMADAYRAIADGFAMEAAQYSYEANRAAIMGGWERRRQDWELQIDQSAKEMERIDHELLAAEIREQVLEAELAVHDEQTRTAKDVADFLDGKLTNAELYGWMVGRLSQLYFTTYNLAYDMAKRAERAYRYELGVQNSAVVRAGHWDGLRSGLLAAEHLTLDLQRLDLAYTDAHRREYELTKSVSLSQLAPEALMALRSGRAAAIELGEGLFDLDYPGHYMRRLKAVRMTLPVVAGPFSGVHCKLTLLGSQVRKDATTGTYTDASHFNYRYGPLESICTSGGQSDPGVFNLNFQDVRYLPFEGAGAISRWRIELPPDANRFDLTTLSDVVLHLSYTARDGGAQLADEASTALGAAPRQGVRMFSLRHEFPVEWNAFATQLQVDPTDATKFDQVLQVSLAGRLPYLSGAGAVKATKVQMAVRWTDETLGQSVDMDVAPGGAVLQTQVAIASTSSTATPTDVPVVAPTAPTSTDAEANPWSIRISHDELVSLAGLTEPRAETHQGGRRIIPDALDDIVLIVGVERAIA